MSLNRWLKQAEKFTADNSPTILTAAGVVGVLTTAYLTGDATVKAVHILDDDRDDRALQKRSGRYVNLDLARPTKMEVFKLVWMVYIPPAGSAILTIAAIIGANRISSRRTAAIAAAYSISEKAYHEYKEKVVERLGEKEATAIRDEIAQDKVSETSKNVLWIPGDHNRCFESYTARYFEGDIETIRRAENVVNKEIIDVGYASLSFFYDELDIPHTAFSDHVGWDIDRMLEINFTATLSEDGKPTLVMTYKRDPFAEFYKFS